LQRQRNRRTNPNHKNRSGEEVRDRTGEVEEQENLKSRKETEQEKFLQQINQKERNHKEKGSSRLKEMRAVLAKHKITRGVSPEKLRLILEDLGPTYIKLGQIMSLHSDILPKAYCDELMKLNSEVTPMPFEAVLRVIEQSYGISWQEVFRFIDDKALGSASIAQVHRAQLLDGKDVIVKVEREGIYDLMSRDIALLHKAVKFLPPVGDLHNLVELDMILLMTVEPGFGGQAYLPHSTAKIRAMRELLQRSGMNTDLEVDGGISQRNAQEVLEAGANILVAGSAVFRGNIEENIAAFQDIMY